MEGAVGGTILENPSKHAAQFCFEHKEELKLYCETCGDLICYKCALKGGKHWSHEYKEQNEAFEKYKEEVASAIEPMEKQVAIIKKALALIEQRCGEISDQREAIEKNVHVTFRRLREVLIARETELIGQLHNMTQRKLKGLAAQSDQIETTLAQLNSCLHFMRESIKVGNESDVLMMRANTIRQVKELTTSFRADSLKPNTEGDIIFSALVDLSTACEKYGQVSKCHVTDKGLESAVVGVETMAILHAEDMELKSELECKLLSEITGTRTSCCIERRGQSQYEIRYQPTIKGRHQLHIKLGGQHVRGSPLLITVKSPIEKLCTPILTIDGVKGPRGVAVNQRGEVVVTEGNISCISVFSPSGKKLRSFGTHGSNQGQFQFPRGLTVDGEGNILVADSKNDHIQKFTAEGQFLATYGGGPMQLNPTDIAFNTSNSKVYVVDYYNNHIQVLNSDLTFYSTFGNQGSDKGQFNDPWGIACDSTGKVYVADLSNHRIQVFTAEGKFVRMFKRRGKGRRELDTPYYVAVDTSGMVYVSEYNNNRVSVFTSEGQFVMSIGKKGHRRGEFQSPYGLAVDNSGVVYVCDCDNDRVQVF